MDSGADTQTHIHLHRGDQARAGHTAYSLKSWVKPIVVVKRLHIIQVGFSSLKIINLDEFIN